MVLISALACSCGGASSPSAEQTTTATNGSATSVSLIDTGVVSETGETSQTVTVDSGDSGVDSGDSASTTSTSPLMVIELDVVPCEDPARRETTRFDVVELG
jgi:hypothetical protein